MLTGKYWITPGGVIDVSDSEHALYARKIMLGLAPEDFTYNVRTMFTPLSARERKKFRSRGVGGDALDFLGQPGNDPRMFAIREWGWVRTRASAFYLWVLDDAALRLVRGARDFWAGQTQAGARDAIDVLELSTGTEFELAVGQVRKAGLGATALRRRWASQCGRLGR